MSEIFTRKWSEISGGRFDPFYYLPEFLELEKQIKIKSNFKLSDFILEISSGATPDKKEAWKYYTDDKIQGIPFLRVQNIKPDCTISDDFIYINRQTHENMLKRSQVRENDLIITITGRLGTAAVAPKGFVGNINQHSVVIKTKNLETSRAIATFLNTGIGEKLVSRRATGGTRPALDYIALRSIPIIFNEAIIAKMDEAYKIKTQKESEAKEILDSIDSYLMQELGINLPNNSCNSLEQRIFTQKISHLSGTRFDPNYHQKYYQDLESALQNSKFPLVKISNVITNLQKGIEVGSNEYQSNGIPFVRVSDIDKFGVNFEKVSKFISHKSYEKFKSDFEPKQGDILYSKDGTIGICLEFNQNELCILSGAILKFNANKNLNSKFLIAFLACDFFNKFAERESIGAVIKHLNVEKFLNLKIPFPPLEVQNQIAQEINKRKTQALKLQQEAKEVVESAKKQVESMILGG